MRAHCAPLSSIAAATRYVQHLLPGLHANQVPRQQNTASAAGGSPWLPLINVTRGTAASGPQRSWFLDNGQRPRTMWPASRPQPSPPTKKSDVPCWRRGCVNAGRYVQATGNVGTMVAVFVVQEAASVTVLRWHRRRLRIDWHTSQPANTILYTWRGRIHPILYSIRVRRQLSTTRSIG